MYTHSTKKDTSVFSSNCVLNVKWPMFSKLLNLVTKQNYQTYQTESEFILFPRKGRVAHVPKNLASCPKSQISPILHCFLTQVATAQGRYHVPSSGNALACSGMSMGLCVGVLGRLWWTGEGAQSSHLLQYIVHHRGTSQHPCCFPSSDRTVGGKARFRS